VRTNENEQNVEFFSDATKAQQSWNAVDALGEDGGD